MDPKSDTTSAISLATLDTERRESIQGDAGKETAPLLHQSAAQVAPPADEQEELVDGKVDKLAGMPTFYRAVFTTISIFMGYSGMIVLQEKLKTRLEIKSGSDDAYVFGIGVSFLYLGNLIFRLMHNVLFSCMRPRQRVMLSYTCMTLAQLTIVIPYYVADTRHLAFVFIAYMLAGVSIGSFESNLISCLTPLGHNTKSWAVLGIPLGFNMISVGSFILFAIWPDDVTLQAGVYVFIALMNLLGLVVYVLFIPNVEFEASRDNVKIFWEDLKKYREWFPIIWKHCIALMFDMFAVSIFSAIALYIFDTNEIPLWPNSDTKVPKNAFSVVYYFFSFCGDFTSRRIAYRGKRRNPFYFLILTTIGAGLVLSKTAIVAPIGMFCVMFANGSIYAHTTKYVDQAVDKKYNLMALSVWLFIGDAGSFVGAQITQPLRTGIGRVEGGSGSSHSELWQLFNI